jgi:hypothetical protein
LAQSSLIFPEREGLADDFVQLGFGFAAAEGEGAGEMFPIFGRKAVKFAGDEGFQRGARLNECLNSNQQFG